MSETITLPNGRTFNVVSSTPAKATVAKRKAHRAIPKPLDGDPVERGTLTLSMAPPSVNSLFHNRKKGRGKTLAYRNWRAFADRELRDQPSWHVPGKVRITIRVGGSKADADNLCKAPLDALVSAGRISDDKHLVEVRAIHDPAVTGSRIEIEAA
jgi:Holliday junction resolvase RusA-like endonuclease